MAGSTRAKEVKCAVTVLVKIRQEMIPQKVLSLNLRVVYDVSISRAFHNDGRRWNMNVERSSSIQILWNQKFIASSRPGSRRIKTDIMIDVKLMGW